MDRESFLDKAWPRFPVARKGWLDVSAFNESPRTGVVVCGRYRSNERAIEFGGATLSIEVENLGWLETPRTATDASLELLRDDDLVAFHVVKIAGAKIGCDAVALLVPSSVKSGFNSSFDVDRSKEWSKFTTVVREFFVSRNFVEAATPTLVPSPGTEPFLDPFATVWEFGSRKTTLFLPTSPEFHLKKMLAAGWPRLFEIKSCFRNGELGEHHQPEFSMLEWYRAFADLDSIADDVEALIAAACKAFAIASPKVERTSMTSLFAEAFDGFTLKPETESDDLRELATASGIGIMANDDFDDLFHRLFLERVEPLLARRDVVILRGYPPSQAALSRIGADGFADRFEVYWRGVELANAFHELNDPWANEARFKVDADKKIALGKRSVPRDEALVEALKHGLPPSGGIALGMDRLFMSLTGLEDIAETRAFPITN